MFHALHRKQRLPLSRIQPLLLILLMGIALVLAGAPNTLLFEFGFFLALTAWGGVYSLWDAKSAVHDASEEAIRHLRAPDRRPEVRQRLRQEPIRWLDRAVVLFLLSGVVLLAYSLFQASSYSSLTSSELWDILGGGIILYAFGWTNYVILWFFRNHPTSRSPFEAAAGVRLGVSAGTILLVVSGVALFTLLYSVYLFTTFEAIGGGVLTLKIVGLVLVLPAGLFGCIYLLIATFPFTRTFRMRETVAAAILIALPIIYLSLISYFGL